MMMNKEELKEYSLKIHTIAKFQEEANKYNKLSILSGMIAGISGILDLNLIASMYLNNDNSIMKFIASLGYSILTASAINYTFKMKNKEKENQEIVSLLKSNLVK